MSAFEKTIVASIGVGLKLHMRGIESWDKPRQTGNTPAESS
jgi:hypothetical protein